MTKFAFELADDDRVRLIKAIPRHEHDVPVGNEGRVTAAWEKPVVWVTWDNGYACPVNRSRLEPTGAKGYRSRIPGNR